MSSPKDQFLKSLAIKADQAAEQRRRDEIAQAKIAGLSRQWQLVGMPTIDRVIGDLNALFNNAGQVDVLVVKHSPLDQSCLGAVHVSEVTYEGAFGRNRHFTVAIRYEGLVVVSALNGPLPGRRELGQTSLDEFNDDWLFNIFAASFNEPQRQW